MKVYDPDFLESGFFVKIRVLMIPRLHLDVSDSLYPSSTSNLNMVALLLARPRGAMGRALSRALHPAEPREVPRGPGWSPFLVFVPQFTLAHCVTEPQCICSLTHRALYERVLFSPSSLLPHFLRPSSHHRECAYAWEDRWGRVSKKAGQLPPSRRHSGSPSWLDVRAQGRE